jgi:hypothetical protein
MSSSEIFLSLLHDISGEGLVELLDNSLINYESEILSLCDKFCGGGIDLYSFINSSSYCSYGVERGLLSYSKHKLNDIYHFIEEIREKQRKLCREQPIHNRAQLLYTHALDVILIRTMIQLAMQTHNNIQKIQRNDGNNNINITNTIGTLDYEAINSAGAANNMKPIQFPSMHNTADSQKMKHNSAALLHLTTPIFTPITHSPQPKANNPNNDSAHNNTSPLFVTCETCEYFENAAFQFYLNPSNSIQSDPRANSNFNKMKSLFSNNANHSNNTTTSWFELLKAPVEHLDMNKVTCLKKESKLDCLVWELNYLWANLIGLLSARCNRSKYIANKFLPYIVTNATDKTKDKLNQLNSLDQSSHAIIYPTVEYSSIIESNLIFGLSNLTVHINRTNSLHYSYVIISTLLSLFNEVSKNNSNHRKRMIGAALNGIIYPLCTADWSLAISYRGWFHLLIEAYNTIELYMKNNNKAKNWLVFGPLLVSILSASDREYFLKKFEPLISLLLNHCYINDSIRSIGVNGVQQLLHVYLYKISSRHETTILNLEAINKAWITSNNSNSNSNDWLKGSTADGLVALILTAAQADPNFALHQIILPMLNNSPYNSNNPINNTPNLHNLTVRGSVLTGIRALSSILCVDDIDEPLEGQSNLTDFNQIFTANFSTTLSRLQLSMRVLGTRDKINFLSLCSSDKALEQINQLNANNSYLQELTVLLGNILLHCHQALNHEIYLLTNPQANSNLSLIQSNHSNTIQCLHLVLRLTQCIWPSTLPTAQLINILIKSAIHSSNLISHSARKLLYLIFQNQLNAALNEEVQSSLKGHIINSLIQLLNSINSSVMAMKSHSTVAGEIIELIAQLLKLWHNSLEIKENSSATELSLYERQLGSFAVEEFEAILLVWLCSNNSSIRVNATKALHNFNNLIQLKLTLFPNKAMNKANSPISKAGRIQSNQMKAEDHHERKYDSEEELDDKSLDGLYSNKIRWSSYNIFNECNCCSSKDQFHHDSLLSNANCKAQRNNNITAVNSNEQFLSLLSDDSQWYYYYPHLMRSLISHSSQQSSSVLTIAFKYLDQRITPIQDKIRQFNEKYHKKGPIQSIAINHSDTTANNHPSSSQDMLLLNEFGLCNEMLKQWHNYTIIASIIYSAIYTNNSSNNDYQWLTTNCINNLSHIHPHIRRLTASVLGNVHWTFYNNIISLLQPIQTKIELYSSQPLSNKNKSQAILYESVRVSLMLIYKFLCEGLQINQLLNDNQLANKILYFIKHSQSFLSITGNEFRWDLFELRKHLCAVIEKFSLSSNNHCEWIAAHNHEKNNQLSSSLQNDFSPSYRSVLFELLLGWCGYGPSSAAYTEKSHQHAAQLLNRIKDKRQAAQLELAYSVELKQLKLSALSAMAALLKGPCFDDSLVAKLSSQAKDNQFNQADFIQGKNNEQMGEEETSLAVIRAGELVLPWLNSILSADDSLIRDIGYIALEWLLENNVQLIAGIITFCYAKHSLLARRYFLVLAQILNKKSQYKQDRQEKLQTQLNNSAEELFDAYSMPFNLNLPVLLHLIIYKLGDPSYNVRSAALKLLPQIEAAAYNQINNINNYKPLSIIIGSHLTDTYTQVQLQLSNRLANEFTDNAHLFLLEAMKRIRSANRSAHIHNQIINYTITWSRKVIFSPDSIALHLKSDSTTCNERRTEETSSDSEIMCYPHPALSVLILSQLLELTNDLFSQGGCDQSLESLWLSIASTHDHNISAILLFILTKINSANTSLPSNLLSTYKRIALYCSRANANQTIRQLIKFIYAGQFNGDVGNSSECHYALLLLVEVAYEIDFKPSQQLHDRVTILSLLFHIGVIGLNSSNHFIRSNSAVLLINSIQATTFKQSKNKETRKSLANNQFLRQSNSLYIPFDSTQESYLANDSAAESSLYPQLAGSNYSPYSTLSATLSLKKELFQSNFHSATAGQSIDQSVQETMQKTFNKKQKTAIKLINYLNQFTDLSNQSSRSKFDKYLDSNQDYDSNNLNRTARVESVIECNMEKIVGELLDIVPSSLLLSQQCNLIDYWIEESLNWGLNFENLRSRNANLESSSNNCSGGGIILIHLTSHRIFRSLRPHFNLHHHNKLFSSLTTLTNELKVSNLNPNNSCSTLSVNVTQLLQLLNQSLLSTSSLFLETDDSNSIQLNEFNSVFPSLFWYVYELIHSSIDEASNRLINLPNVALEELLISSIKLFDLLLLHINRINKASPTPINYYEFLLSNNSSTGVEFIGLQPLLIRLLLAKSSDLNHSDSTADLPNEIFQFLGRYCTLNESQLLDPSSHADRFLINLFTRLPFIIELISNNKPDRINQLYSTGNQMKQLFHSMRLNDLAEIFQQYSLDKFSTVNKFLLALSPSLCSLIPSDKVIPLAKLLINMIKAAYKPSHHLFGKEAKNSQITSPTKAKNLRRSNSFSSVPSSSSSMNHNLTLIQSPMKCSEPSVATKNIDFTRLSYLIEYRAIAQARTLANINTRLHDSKHSNMHNNASSKYIDCILNILGMLIGGVDWLESELNHNEMKEIFTQFELLLTTAHAGVVSKIIILSIDKAERAAKIKLDSIRNGSNDLYNHNNPAALTPHSRAAVLLGKTHNNNNAIVYKHTSPKTQLNSKNEEKYNYANNNNNLNHVITVTTTEEKCCNEPIIGEIKVSTSNNANSTALQLACSNSFIYSTLLLENNPHSNEASAPTAETSRISESNDRNSISSYNSRYSENEPIPTLHTTLLPPPNDSLPQPNTAAAAAPINKFAAIHDSLAHLIGNNTQNHTKETEKNKQKKEEEKLLNRAAPIQHFSRPKPAARNKKKSHSFTPQPENNIIDSISAVAAANPPPIVQSSVASNAHYSNLGLNWSNTSSINISISHKQTPSKVSPDYEKIHSARSERAKNLAQIAEKRSGIKTKLHNINSTRALSTSARASIKFSNENNPQLSNVSSSKLNKSSHKK